MCQLGFQFRIQRFFTCDICNVRCPFRTYTHLLQIKMYLSETYYTIDITLHGPQYLIKKGFKLQFCLLLCPILYLIYRFLT
jgi:hypothetical protein